MNDTLDSVIRAFIAYRYTVLFAGLALENAAFLGFLVPGITILIVSGYLIATGRLDPAPAFAAGYAGTLLGDNINYLAGRYCAGRLRILDSLLRKTPEVRTFLHDRPRWQYLFFHFPLYLRTVFPLTLGAAVYPISGWIAVDLPAAALFNVSYMLIGYLIGRSASGLEDSVRWGNIVGIAFSLALAFWTFKLVLVLLRSLRDYRRSRHSQPEDTP